MNVSKEDIKNIKPGTFEPFLCESPKAMHSAVSQASQLKTYKELPEGVVDYESQKYLDKNIIIIHAIGEGEKKVLNRS